MVFVNPARRGALITTILLSGCAGLGSMNDPVSAPEKPEVDVVAAAVTQVESAPGSEHRYLPRQAYDAQGEKVTYVPAPNPYTTAPVAVPSEVIARFQRANELMVEEQHRDARKAFEAITRDYPDLSGPWVKLGELAEIGERMERAEKSYRKALEVNPDNVNAYLSLALFQRRTGDFDGARATYLSALQLWSDFPGAHLNLAILYDLYLNQPKKAQPHYEAYQFLVGDEDPRVADWLIEVRRRTGIETSFIDIPPPPPETTGEAAASEPMAADKSPAAEQTEENG